MANDCLVREYKKIVNNDNLVKLNEIKVTVDLDKGYAVPGLYVKGIGSTINVPSGAVMQVNDSVVTSPYTVPNTETMVKVTYDGHDEVEVSIMKKNLLKVLIVRGNSKISETFQSLQFIYDGTIEALGFYQGFIGGSLLDIVSYNSRINRIVLDSPNQVIEDGNVRELLNMIAASGRTANLTMAARAGSFVYNGLTDIPALFNGTYNGRESIVHFSSDTTTYPHGWYGKRPDNKWFNANDEEIQAP